MGFFKSLVKSFIKLSRPRFSFDENQLKFKINSDKFYIYEIEDYETKTRHDSYVIDAYTIKTENLFIEHIQIDNDVQWRGLASSLYTTFLKEKLGLKSMKILETKEYDGYDFITYEIDEHFILNFIYIYEINKDTFILDAKSELYENLLQNFDSSYTYRFPKNKDTKMNIDISIVRDNAFMYYFGLEN